jgi:hypothetical protein
MSYIIFTSPRTGSTEFIKRLVLLKRGPIETRNLPGGPTVLNLIEFFNPPCIGAFGDLVHLYYNPNLNFYQQNHTLHHINDFAVFEINLFYLSQNSYLKNYYYFSVTSKYTIDVYKKL